VSAAERDDAMATTDALHNQMRSKIETLGNIDWARQGPVRYETGSEPYLTSPADLLGWLTDHYIEHVPQIADLIDEWRKTRSLN
jgi:hypothetical protein